MKIFCHDCGVNLGLTGNVHRCVSKAAPAPARDLEFVHDEQTAKAIAPTRKRRKPGKYRHPDKRREYMKLYMRKRGASSSA
jgi:hypothetical protein